MTDTLRTATLAARARTGDNTIGVAVRRGTFQVQRITYPNGATAVIRPLTHWLDLSEAVEALNDMEAQ